MSSQPVPRPRASGYTDALAQLAVASEAAFAAPVFVISVAAEMAGMHPQTLRQYDRMGLVQPGRAPGGGRRYSARDVMMLREVGRLSQEEGVNLVGIKRIMELERGVAALQHQLAEVTSALALARAQLRQATTGALVVWRPQPLGE